MFYFFFVPILFLSPLIADSNQGPSASLADIDRQIEALQSQANELQKGVVSDYHQEMVWEMQGQKRLVDYEWSALSQSMKRAEAAEQSAHSKEAKIRQLNQKIKQLTEEREALLKEQK